MIKDYGNVHNKSREELQAIFGGEVLDTRQLEEKYRVIGFAAPIVILEGKQDGQRYTAEFQHMPRYYFLFSKVD